MKVLIGLAFPGIDVSEDSVAKREIYLTRISLFEIVKGRERGNEKPVYLQTLVPRSYSPSQSFVKAPYLLVKIINSSH